MGNLLVLLTFASFIAIFYFWLKKHNKKWIIISIIATFVFGGLYSLTPEYKQEEAKQEQEDKKKQELKEKKEKQEQEKKSEDKKHQKELDAKKEASRSTLLKRAKSLKYGMSVTEVKKIMKVKPSKEEKDEVGNMTLMYGNYVVYLGFDKNNKLLTAMNGAPQIAKQGEKASTKKKEKRDNYYNKLKGFAQSFGIKPSEEIQRMPSVYRTVEDGDNLYILWNPGEGLPILLRKDNTLTNVTTVYIYSKKGDPEGKLLYTGRTIVQKNKRSNIYY